MNMKLTTITLLAAAILFAGCTSSQPLLISVIGTNDVHGQLIPKTDPTHPESSPAGLAVLSGYVEATRQARQADGGAVLLIDAGDMWQGTLESNLSEGASVVAAYNALGYTAAAVGNHEFDFGPVGSAPIPTSDLDDARGALKLRASEADFPFLAANLIDDTTGKAVRWENVRPAVIVDVQGVKVGIIGVMTRNALVASIAANTHGLSVAPLAPTIEREALQLREAGASIVIVTAHAGGACADFNDPYDTSTCRANSEIFAVAEALPTGLVDHIIAGHEHQGIAHFVNDIAITSSFSRTMAFGRVDMRIDRKSGALLDTRIFPPQPLRPGVTYEGVDVAPKAAVSKIIADAEDKATELRNQAIGITLATPFDLRNNPESTLGNLFVDSLLDTVDADIAMHINGGGIRANLPAGPLLYGSVYEMMPFDNTLVVIELTGRQLRQVIAEQAHRGPRRVGFSGMRVNVACDNQRMSVGMRLDDGKLVEDDETIRIALANYVAMGGDRVLDSVIPDGGFSLPDDAPLVRDVIIRSLQQRGGSIEAQDFLQSETQRWNLPDDLSPSCSLPN